MKLEDLRSWLIENEVEDSWWISVDGDVQNNTLTLTEAAEQKKIQPWSEIMVLPVSYTAEEDPPWQELEMDSPASELVEEPTVPQPVSAFADEEDFLREREDQEKKEQERLAEEETARALAEQEAAEALTEDLESFEGSHRESESEGLAAEVEILSEEVELETIHDVAAPSFSTESEVDAFDDSSNVAEVQTSDGMAEEQIQDAEESAVDAGLSPESVTELVPEALESSNTGEAVVPVIEESESFVSAIDPVEQGVANHEAEASVVESEVPGDEGIEQEEEQAIDPDTLKSLLDEYLEPRMDALRS